MRRSNLEIYKFVSPECFFDMTRAYENLRGENCPLKNPEILIKFHRQSQVYISKIEIQRENRKYPGNIRQIQATFFDANDSLILDEITGEPMYWISSENKPIILGYFENVRGLKLKILRTDNNENVRRLRIKITGCYTTGLTN